MPDMTPAPISVDGAPAKVHRYDPRITPNPKTGRVDYDGMAAFPNGKWVLHSDYATLLHQLEEMEAEVESTLACNRGLVRLNEAVTARAESAERAREEATGLLREAEPEINELSNIYYSEFSNTKREKETEALHSRIAAFLAASGGKVDG